MLSLLYYHFIVNPIKRRKLNRCGNGVHFEKGVDGNFSNMRVGNDIHFGKNNLFMCSNKANIIIGDHVMFGPNVTMITGDHRIDVAGKYMTEVKGKDKLPENDKPIVLEGDNWICANAIILKGVTVGIGAVVAAGAVVINNVPPYSIVGGGSGKSNILSF